MTVTPVDGGTGTTGTVQNNTAAWHASLPEDLRGNASLTKFNDVETLARSYISASGLIGKDPNSVIDIPKDDAGRLSAYRKLGALDKPEGYKFKEHTHERAKPLGPLLAKVAAENGLHPSQAQKIYDVVASHVVQGASDDTTKADAQHAANIEALKGVWPADKYDERVRTANNGLAHLEKAAGLGEGGSARLMEKLNKAGLGTDPDIMRALAVVGDLTAEDDSGAARGGGKGGGGNFNGATAASHEEKAREYQQQAVNSTDYAERKRLNGLAMVEYEKAAKIANG